MFAGTYEEFETGPWHGTSAQPKQSWGGIPDIWFTSEVLVGLRHFLGLAAFKRNAFLKDVMCGLQNLMRDLFIAEEETTGSLSLWHGAPSEWRAGDALISSSPAIEGRRLLRTVGDVKELPGAPWCPLGHFLVALGALSCKKMWKKPSFLHLCLVNCCFASMF